MTDRSRRVLLVSFIADAPWTGMGRWTYAVRDGLRARGWEVDTWFADQFPRVRGLGRLAVLIFPPLLALRLLVQRHRYDVVVIHEPVGAWYGVARHFIPGLPPMVAMCHNVERHCFEQMLGYAKLGLAEMSAAGRVKAPLTRFWQCDATIRLASQVVCLSSTDADYITHNLSVPASRITRVVNGTDAEDFVTRASRPGGQAVLQVGGWLDIKGRRVLPRLWRQLRERVPAATLTLVGTGVEASSVIADFDARDRASITVRPRVEGREDMHRLFAQADLYLMTSLSEGSPLALLEALAAGLPVVATQVGGIPDIVTDGTHALLFSPERPDDGAAKIARLLGNPADAQRLATAGQARARALSWAHTVEQLATVLTAALPNV